MSGHTQDSTQAPQDLLGAFNIDTTKPRASSEAPSHAETIKEKEQNEKTLAITTVSAAPSFAEKAAVMEEKHESDEKISTPEEKIDPDSDRYVTGYRLFLVFVALLLSVFLVSLDQTIVSTALPSIASQFNALNDLSWVVSAYFLTQVGLILTSGQILTIADTKFVYLAAITIFEIGSLLCGVAWNMKFLIFGRAVQGVGAACIFVSILIIIARVTRLEQRPALFGAFGGVGAIASVVGPLLGGVFTDHATWRWCFYINLPFGAISIVAVIFLLKSQPTTNLPGNAGKTRLQKWVGIDWIGTVLCLGMITPLLLALQWGGNTRKWNDKVIIALFCVFAVVLPAFCVWEWKKGKRAIMPLHLYKRKTQIGASAASMFAMMSLILSTYYLPFYYQASRGRSPTQSGIDILPLMLSIILAAGISGAVINTTGRYIWWLRLGPLVAAVGAGLLYTITIETSTARLIGYQILFGVGVGTALQNPVIAVQTEWADREDLIPQASSILTFFQLLGGVMGVTIAGSVFANQLRANLAIYAPELDPTIAEAVRQTLSVLSQLPEDTRAKVLQAYVRSLDWVFIVGVPASVAASLSSLLITDHNVKDRGSAAMHLA